MSEESRQVLDIGKLKTLIVLKILWEETDDLAGDEQLDDKERRKHSLRKI